ncbi:MAG: hypothetical protein JXK05_05165 [Campylobacterales bacterium]|nr:hypothetical protein [Campylobacterales bacterium]
MKKLALIFALLSGLLHASFYSVHQAPQSNGVQGAVNQFNSIVQSGSYGYFTHAFTLDKFQSSNEYGLCDQNGYEEVKLYVPGGATSVKILFSTERNTNFKIYSKFEPSSGFNTTQTTLFDNVNYQQPASYHFIANNAGLLLFPETTLNRLVGTTGGWLYLMVINDTPVRPSSYINNKAMTLNMSYTLFINNHTNYKTWLNRTYIQSNGDPVESAANLYVTSNSCSSGPRTSTYALSTSGTLYDGSGSYEPEPELTPQEQCEQQGKYWIASSSTCTTQEVYNCIVTQAGTWNTGENRCVTPAEVACNNVSTTKWYVAGSECLDKTKTVNGQLMDGYWNISEFRANSEGWSTQLSVRNLNTNASSVNTTAVKVLNMQQSVQSLLRTNAVAGTQTWQTKLYESGGKVYFETIGDSANRSELNPKINVGSIKVESSPVDRLSELQVTADITYTAPSSSSSSSQSKSIEQIECENGGNVWSAEINQCMYTTTSSRSSSSYSSVAQNDTQLRAECESLGNYYTWNTALRLCMYSPPAVSSSSRSSSSSSSSTSVSSAEQECLNRGEGYLWNNELRLCLQVAQSSSSVSSTISDAQVRSVVVPAVAAKTYDIAGYFIHFGSGSYDWAYVTTSGGIIAKLTGIDQNGFLTWEKLKYGDVNLLSGAEFNANFTQVTFGELLSVPGTDSSTAQKLAAKTFEITGVFVHYDSGAYDWIYTSLSGSVSAKLTGLDEATGYLTWVWLEGNGIDAFSSIELLPGNTIHFGTAK